MEEIYRILLLFSYPISLTMFAVGSIVLLYKDRGLVNVWVCFGFVLLLAGYLLQNYGPSDISYDEQGNAIIQYSWAFTLGRISAAMGIILAASSYLFKAVDYAAKT